MSGLAMKLSDVPEFVEHFRRRVLQDALTEATAAHWRGRAETFAAAMPRAGDFTGLPSGTTVPDIDWEKGWPTEGTSRFMRDRKPVDISLIPHRAASTGPHKVEIEAQRYRIAATELACRQRAVVSLGGVA